MPPGLRYMMLSALSLSVMAAFVKALGRQLSLHQVVFSRSVVTLLLSYWMLRRAGVAPWGHARWWLVLRGLLGFVGLNCLFFGITRLPLAEATVLQYLYPVFIALLAVPLLGERPSLLLLASLAVSTLGVVVVARPGFLSGDGGSLDGLATAVAIAGAFFSGAVYVVVRRLSQREHSLVIVFYFPLVALPLSTPSAVATWVWPTALEWLLLLGVGLSTQAAQVTLTRGLQSESATRASSVSYLQIVFAALWGWLLFGERPHAWTWAGALLVFAGTVLATRARGAKPSGAEPRELTA